MTAVRPVDNFEDDLAELNLLGIVQRGLTNRFLRRVDRSGECWLWTAATMRGGYGKFVFGHQRYVPAHRFSYAAFNGPIPDGLYVCHACDNPPCVNPTHLWIGTHQDNQRDRLVKGRVPKLWGRSLNQSRQTVCKRGHPFSGDNVYVSPSTGYRHCRECMRYLARRWYHQTKGRNT